jgi:hypothetical protein
MISNIIIIILIILLIIILTYNCKDFFTIIGNSSNNGKSNIEEIYNWPCSGCLSIKNTLKPKFLYNLSDSRCLKNKSKDYSISYTYIDKINSYLDIPNTNIFESCDSNFNTMYSTCIGRYIRITKSTPFYLSSIKVLNKLGIISNNAIVYNNLGNYININIENTNEIISSFILIDLLENIEISQIILINLSQTSADTLLNVDVTIAYDIGSIYKAKIVSNIKITNRNLNNLVYTQNNIKTDSYIFLNIKSIWPCSDCLTKDNKMYRTFNYKIGRKCFKPNEYKHYSYLDSYLSGFTQRDEAFMYFKSCSQLYDSRVSPLPLLLWLDSSDLNTVYQDTNGDIPSILKSPIKLWKDKSGNNNDAYYNYGDTILTTDSTSGNKTVISGSFAFKLTNPYLLIPCSEISLFVVMRNTGFSMSPFNTKLDGQNDSWIQAYGSIYESLGFENVTKISYDTSYKKMLYVLTCNSVTNKTTIYNGYNRLYQNNFSIINWNEDDSNMVSIGSYVSGYYTYNGNLMEIRLYSYCLTENTSPKLSEIVSELMLKWKI